MKKLILILITITILLASCKNYKGYKKVEVSDEHIGSIRILEEWEIINVDGWDYIRDINAPEGEYIAVQYYYGENYFHGKIEIDNRIFNEYFKEYTYTSTEVYAMDSVGSRVDMLKFSYLDSEINFYLLYLDSHDSNVTYYAISFVFIDKSVNVSIIKKIMQSYNP